MEDGVKEDPAQSKEPKFLGKAGWVKKAHGRVLSSYKDRFIHVVKTEIVVYENEDLQNCLERLDLENYDKCHELKSPFKKKHRLILIRSPKSANKVHDVKFQAQTAEDKEDWIKALSDCINRAKNKIFDEVRVDESANLEHVTRSRPKGNRGRRPPTRIHMKEVAGMSSDGILRLDLDLENAVMPNGTQQVSDGGAKTENRTPPSASWGSDAPEKESEEKVKTEPEASPQKKVLKPPMPPIKEAKASTPQEVEPEKEEVSEKKVLKPPMPPSKDVKPSVSPKEEEETAEKEEAEKSPDTMKKTCPPPMPPNKPNTSSSNSNLTEESQFRLDPHPPTLPSKDMKPSSPAKKLDQNVNQPTDVSEEKEDDRGEVTGEVRETDETEQSIRNTDDGSEGPSADKQASDEPEAPTESPKRSPTTPVLSKKPEIPLQPHEDEDHSAPQQSAPDASLSSPQTEEKLSKREPPTVVVSLNDPVADGLGLNPLLEHFPGEKRKKSEEKSVDSGQHSDDDSDGSGTEDTLAASTAALRGSSAGLDVLDAGEDDIQACVSSKCPQVTSKPHLLSKAFPSRCSELPPKPAVKARSASFGNLLAGSPVCKQVEQQPTAEAGGGAVPSEDVVKLEVEVALEMEKTKELLSRMPNDGEVMPEDLLTKAMEKLRKADHVLREVKKLTPARNLSFRKSW